MLFCGADCGLTGRGLQEKKRNVAGEAAVDLMQEQRHCDENRCEGIHLVSISRRLIQQRRRELLSTLRIFLMSEPLDDVIQGYGSDRSVIGEERRGGRRRGGNT